MASEKKVALGEDLVKIAVKQLASSAEFKRPRLMRIKKYEELYAGKIARQPRVRFNVPIPVFPGMIDTLQADLNDRVDLEFVEKNPADFKAVQKLNAAWQQQSSEVRLGGMWQKKFRWARRDLIFSGRGIIKTFGQSDPFAVNMDQVSYLDFHCEPMGGGHLETHLFAGQESIYRSESQLKENADAGIYDKGQVKKLIDLVGGSEYRSYLDSVWASYAEYQARFSALDLNAENNYVGEKMFHLAEWVMTYKGKRWYLVFEPYTGIWVRCDKLTDVFSNGLFPWTSWASHENDKLFWSKAFADDLYPVAESIVVLFNQDLENRQRRMSNARAYDKDMFKNVQELFEAQSGRDRLVRANTFGGTRRISEGVYEFQTPEITGTINLIEWLEGNTGKNLGVSDLQQGASQPASKKVRVAYAELAQISKRLAFSSAPFIEMAKEIGGRFIGVVKDYLTEPMAVKVLGENGFELTELKRVELNTEEEIGASVTSKSSMDEENREKTAGRKEALTLLANSPNINSRWRDEEILRTGGYSDEAIKVAMDTSSDFSRVLQAEVSQAIISIMNGKMPPTNFGVDWRYLQTMMDFAIDHRSDKKGQKAFPLFEQYIQRHLPIAMDNAKRRAMFKNPQAMGMGDESGAASPLSRVARASPLRTPAPVVPGAPDEGNLPPISGVPQTP
jgi:hypothetical protein